MFMIFYFFFSSHINCNNVADFQDVLSFVVISGFPWKDGSSGTTGPCWHVCK